MVEYEYRSSVDSILSTSSVSHFASPHRMPLTVAQSESMVEIKRTDLPRTESSLPRSEEDDKYRLIYSKSKVYVNPTAYARDNIPGFVALVKRVGPRALVHLHLMLTVCLGGD